MPIYTDNKRYRDWQRYTEAFIYRICKIIVCQRFGETTQVKTLPTLRTQEQR